MSLQSHLKELQLKHKHLEQEIFSETQRPLPDNQLLSDLKRKKLVIKEKISTLESRLKDPQDLVAA